MKGLVDENAIVQYKDQVKGPIQQTKYSDAEWVEYFDSVKTLKLVISKAKQIKLNQVVVSSSITTQLNTI